jgi:hypothetical protein
VAAAVQNGYWPIIFLGIALVVCIVGDVLIVLENGSAELAATGLGALTTLLAGALVWKVRGIVDAGKNGDV